MNGIVYVAFGKRSGEAVANSYKSVLKFNNLPAAVIGDYQVDNLAHVPWAGESPWQENEPLGQRFYAGRVKPFLYNYSPFEKTLYLDADTEILQSLTPGFALLDQYDVCIADDGRKLEHLFRKSKQGPAWDWIRDQRDFTHDYLGKPLNSQINTGVIFFKKSVDARLLFSNWYTEWLRFPKWDEQFAFMRAEHNCKKTKIKHLSPQWNSNNPNLEELVIYHYWGKQKARDLYADNVSTDFLE